MSELDTIRWGDVKAIATTVGADHLALQTSAQLIRAQSKRPVVWGFRIIILPQLQPTENATFTVTFTANIGSGSNGADIPFIYTLAPTAGVYLPITDFQQLPASDVNVNVSAKSTTLADTTASQALVLGAFVAPITAFQGLEALYESLASDVPPVEGTMRWMHGQPFQDDPLNYKPRR